MEEDYRKILTDYIGLTTETLQETYNRKNKEAVEAAKKLAEQYKWKNPDKVDMSYDKTKISPHVRNIVKNLSGPKYEFVSVPTGNIYRSSYNNNTYLEYKNCIISKSKINI